MARKPNFEFERRERDKEKAAKRAEKTKAKNEKKAEEADASLPPSNSANEAE